MKPAMMSQAICLALLLTPPLLAQTQKATNPKPPAQKNRSAEQAEISGRYQIVFGDEGAFLIDTATGKVWQRKIFGFISSKPQAWVYMDRIDSESELITFEKVQMEGAATMH